MDWLERLLKEEDGQAMTEYGLLVGLIALAVIATLVTLGGSLDGLFQDVVDAIPE